jgi:hypothetical protein
MQTMSSGGTVAYLPKFLGDIGCGTAIQPAAVGSFASVASLDVLASFAALVSSCFTGESVAG